MVTPTYPCSTQSTRSYPERMFASSRPLRKTSRDIPDISIRLFLPSHDKAFRLRSSNRTLQSLISTLNFGASSKNSLFAFVKPLTLILAGDDLFRNQDRIKRCNFGEAVS